MKWIYHKYSQEITITAYLFFISVEPANRKHNIHSIKLWPFIQSYKQFLTIEFVLTQNDKLNRPVYLNCKQYKRRSRKDKKKIDNHYQPEILIYYVLFYEKTLYTFLIQEHRISLFLLKPLFLIFLKPKMFCTHDKYIKRFYLIYSTGSR